MDKETLIIGHRGAKGYEPENTLISLKKAIELGCDYVEFDVRLTKDNYPVLFHDKKLNRVSNLKGKLKNKSLSEIKRARTKQKKQKIPTLEEVFKELKDEIKFIIEIKEINALKSSLELIKKYSLQKDSIIISFKPKILIQTKKIMPEIKTAFLWSIFSRIIHGANIQNKFNLTKQIGAQAIYPHQIYISDRFMIKAKKYGLEVYAYLANDSKTIKKLLNCDVNMIESDYPDKILKIKKIKGKNLRKLGS